MTAGLDALVEASALYAKLLVRRREADLLDEYYEGQQPLAYASREWAEWHKDRYVGFADNWCGVVANSPAERLRINGLTVPDESFKPGVQQLWSSWQRNDGDAKSSQGLLQSIISKRSFVIVWGDDDNGPTFTWEHPSQVYIDEAPGSGYKRAMIKAWADGPVEYLTLYKPDAVWKWQRAIPSHSGPGRSENGLVVVRSISSGMDGWEPRQPKGDDVWPIPNPMGKVPGVEYPNRPRLRRGPISDISGTKAMQDAINLLWAYLFTSADHASFPARVVLGQEPPKVPVMDKDGQKVGERAVDLKELAHGRFLWLTGQDTTVDQWDSAKLDVFTDVIEIAVGHIAAQTRTPSHYLITQSDNVPASGYELSEAGLAKKVEEAQLFFSASVREHTSLMALAGDDKVLADAMRTATVNWAPAWIRSESQMADAILKKRTAGYPFEYLLEYEGHGPDEVARIMRMVERESAQGVDPYLALVAAKDSADADSASSVDG